jgi:hypothetical protein
MVREERSRRFCPRSTTYSEKSIWNMAYVRGTKIRLATEVGFRPSLLHVDYYFFEGVLLPIDSSCVA